jgi:hypothetical protein
MASKWASTATGELSSALGYTLGLQDKTHGLCGRHLKGHGNEADVLGFLQKLGPHRSLTLPFVPFRFWLRILGDIRNRKTTP